MTNNDDLAIKLKAAAAACEQQEPLMLVVYHGKMCLRNTGGIVFTVLRDSAFPEYSAENESYARLAEVSNPANILALLAERDADKKRVAETEEVLCKLLPGVQYMDPPDGGQVEPIEQVVRMVEDYRQRIAELETVSTAAEKLVRCKGRYHSEQNYRALAALFGASTPDLPPLETEARTVSVKLPKKESEQAVAYGGSGAFRMGRASGFNEAIDIMSERLAAAGIKLEVGE